MKKNFYVLLMVLVGISAPCSPAAAPARPKVDEQKKSLFKRLISKEKKPHSSHVQHLREECADLPERPQPASVPPIQPNENTGRMKEEARNVIYIPSKTI